MRFEFEKKRFIPSISSIDYRQNRIALFFLAFLFIGHLYGIKPHPPLVPEGEIIENFSTMLNNITRNDEIWAITFSPYGSIMASFSMHPGYWQLWEVASGDLIKIIPLRGGFWLLGRQPCKQHLSMVKLSG